MRLAAVIVETRPIPNLIGVIKEHLSFLPKNTLYVFGGIEVQRMILDSDLECRFFYIKNKINEIEYNKLLTSVEFWNLIDEENILIFQHDSKLLRKGIEEFYDFDFIGAPLYHIPFPSMNGGLSFRKKEAMQKICKTVNYNQSFHGNEDIFFCNEIKMRGWKLPSKYNARLFSVETIFNYGSFGCHAAEKWHKKTLVEKLYNQYESNRENKASV